MDPTARLEELASSLDELFVRLSGFNIFSLYISPL